jgi:hypothetical protein
MKKLSTLSLIVLALLMNQAKAQEATFSLSDLNGYVNAYTSPFAKAMPIGLSGGWATTAKTHSTLGFDLTLSTSLIMIPSSEGSVLASSINLPGSFSFADPNAAVPTIRGDKGMTPPDINIELQAGSQSQTLPFTSFKGLNMGIVPSAAIQLGFGLPKGTDVMVRFIPDFSGTVNKMVPDGVDVSLEKTGMWGLGVKHDIKQWIPVVSKVPFLQISALVAYSRFNTGFSGGALEVTPSILGISNGTQANNDALWEDQSFKMTTSSFSANLLVGASLPVFQPFIGLGLNRGSFESGFYGTYPIVEINSTNGNLEVNDSEKDPLVVKQKVNNFNFQAGARLKLGPIVFHYALSMQKYNMHTAGLAVTLR